MKFNNLVGNPPFQDGNKKGGQNKIYNFFAKNALELVSDDGNIAFITPTSVCKKSKRFSLVGLPGLKLVDFTADNHFDVGSKICYWIINKQYHGNISVRNSIGDDVIPMGEVIYDYSVVDKYFSQIYNALRDATKNVNNRMFKHNAIDMSRCRSPKKGDDFIYPMYKLNSDGTKEILQYNSVKPKLFNENKLIVCITKTFNEKMTIVDTCDFDMKHLSTQVNNNDEVKNIKSFIFSDYFVEHVRKWKEVDGYGYNYALLYLPPFDKTKPWTNEEVKEFIESYVK